jgi:hypothetical protein
MQPKTKGAPQENIFLSLVFNLALPYFVLTKLSGPADLGPFYSLVISVSIPLCYAVFLWLKTRSYTWLSVLGVLLLLSKGLAILLKVSSVVFAIQEFCIPVILGVMVVATQYTSKPLIKEMLFNEAIFDYDLILSKATKSNQTQQLDRLFYQIAYAFLASSLLLGCMNFYFSMHIITAPVGSALFTKQLATMLATSYVTFLVLKLFLFGGLLAYFFKKLKNITGIESIEAFFVKK